MMTETLSWLRKDWVDTGAKALGVYITLLLVRFRVRLRTDIPVLYGVQGKIEERLKPYLSVFLSDNSNKLSDAIYVAKEFFNALFVHTAYDDYESVLDRIETDFYALSEEDVHRFMDILRASGIMFLDIVPAPALEEDFIQHFLI